ncbi:uncharacterized protein LOC106069146 isoform X3 [Biomphalaria glabrata]|uniref:Uncharacterized protein LOC106069146 isoform X3 n=1 Tax=Biomphalaria glabrata TaxID=6526 RepID=A0A9W2ZK91_BIOGL|nr:uncharacterized protein LOC106069146 isoform X3 [Biomphalaria glabrata]
MLWIKSLLMFSSISFVTPASEFTVTFECPPGWTLIGTHCFNFIGTKLDFYDAHDTCKKYGSVLLNVRDEVEAKNISLQAAIEFRNSSHDHYWISNGYYDDVNNVSQAFINPNCSGYWQINEPSAIEGRVAVASDMFGKWALKSVWIDLPFVCRAPACPSGSYRCSNGMCLNQRWKCDNILDCADGSDENDCSDCIRHFKASYGTLSSSNGNNCQWILEGVPGEVLSIHFERALLMENAASLFVYSGGPTIQTSILVKELRGNSSRLTVFGVNHFLIIRLRSYSSSLKPVINARWKEDKELTKVVEYLHVPDDAIGTIVTPSFGLSSAPTTYNKKWIVTTDINSVLTVEIENTTLEVGSNEDSELVISPVSFALHEPNTKRAIYISSSSSLTIRARVNQQQNKYMTANVWKGCSFNTTFTVASLELRSKLILKECLWRFNNGLQADFSVMMTDIQFDGSSNWLKIYNGTQDINDNVLLNTINSSVGQLPIFNLDRGVSFIYSSNSESASSFKAKISTDCEEIPDVTNMQIIKDVNRLAGESYSVNISCSPGFAFQQEEYNYTATLQAVCREGGVWDWGSDSFKRYPKCQVVYCGIPPALQNGYIESLDNVTYNASVLYKCFDGFVMNGTSTSTCQPHGQWSPAGSCQAENCADVPLILNGYHNYTIGSNSTYGTIVKYFCDPGFHLIGSEQIVCLHDKTWSHSAPTCKKLTCNLPLVKYGYYSTFNWIIEYNESVRLHCYGGFKNNRTNTTEAVIKCNQDRKLNFEDSCIDRDECTEKVDICHDPLMNCVNVFGSYECICQDGYNLTNSNCLDIDECSSSTPVCHQQCTNLDGSYNCSCDDGFDLYTANNTNGFILPAGEDGTKPGHVYHINHTCVRKFCDHPPPSIANGTVLSKKDIFMFNESVEIVCDFGFALNGSSLALCTSNGNWRYGDKDIPPACIMIECLLPPKSQLELSRDPPNSSFIKAGESLTIVCEQQCENCSNITKALHCAPNSKGTFSLQGDNPHCFAVNCSYPPWAKMSGVIPKDINDTTYGSSFEFECDGDKGYELHGRSSLGNTTVKCQRNGLWGLDSLICQGMHCGDPGTLAGTEQIVQYSYEVGQSVHYKCTRPGYKTKTNDTLHCLFSNGTAFWSGEAPICEDAEKPNITCPELPVFNLYDTLTYNLPNTSDNSGYACLVLESGPPSGVSVVSKNITLTLKAFDLANNIHNISCDVVLKDQTRPWIQCPGTIDYDLGSKMSDTISVQTLEYLILHSNDGNITYVPSALNLTLGSNVNNVTARIEKDNGHSAECAFLIQPITRTCTTATLTAPANGEIKDCTGTNTSMNCSAQCKAGYIYQDLTTAKLYTCTDGTWSTQTPTLPCLNKMNTLFFYNITIYYNTTGIHLPPSGFNKTYCFQSHEAQLVNLTHNMKACNLSEFRLENVKSDESSLAGIKSTFSLIANTNGLEEAFLQYCAKHIENSTYFNQTYPTIPAGSGNCLAPWNLSKSEVTPGSLSCEKGYMLIKRAFCVQCGPGYYLNNSKCTECSDGTYQDLSNQVTCKSCHVRHSYWPRTSEKHCYSLCPDGFTSLSGYITDNCTQCPANTYSSDNRTECLNCTSSAMNKIQCSDRCQKGQYSNTGYKPCKPCPMHFYGGDGISCQECPYDTYTLNIGSPDETACENDIQSPENSGIVASVPCVIKDHRLVCQCHEGYYGDQCNETCTFCSSKPCYHEGQCQENGSNFTCECKEAVNCTFVSNQTLKYTTDLNYVNYEQVRNKQECEEMCFIEKTCLAYLYSYDPLPYCFKYHQLLFDTSNNLHQSYVKICSKSALFEGDLCEIDANDDCNKHTCTDKQFCMDLVNGTQCVCPLDGIYEANCTKKENMCDSHPCVHGTCQHFGTVRYICMCEPGYTGQNCTEDIDDCALNQHGCLYNGSCINNINNYTCSCNSGFQGTHCEIRPNLCSSNGCLEKDGGFCVEDYLNLNYRCVCGENYNLSSQGQMQICEAKNFCQSSPCQNGGTCLRESDSFSCQCTDGFEGSLCQIEIKTEKNETTCESIDVCQSAMKEYFCHWCSSSNASCTHISCLKKCRNFLNITLEERLLCQCFCNETTTENECLLYDPCLHGGTCTNTTDGYSCLCPTGWTGQVCETSVDYCSWNNNSCLNNAHCYNLVNDTYCQCPHGTTGKTCELKKELCENYGNFSCIYGSCEPVGGSAQCKCPDSYTGESCELLKDVCSPDPCHGGKCSLTESSFQCDCFGLKESFGEFCNDSSDSCSLCPSNSNCTRYTDREGIMKTACLCPPVSIHSGGLCTEVNKDFDLVFLKDFAIKKQWITSVRGFSLENVTSLTLTMWLAAAKSLNDSDVILSLTSAQGENLLSILSSKVRFNSTDIPLSCVSCPMGADNNWHFISVKWSTNGIYAIGVDIQKFTGTAQFFSTIESRYASVSIGQGFSGYISHVQLWKSELADTQLALLYDNKSYIPEPQNLLLGWTYYSFDENVFMSNVSMVNKETSICTGISFGASVPSIDICNKEDKEPPWLNEECKLFEWIATSYHQHQISSSQLGYTFNDNSVTVLPKLQYFSHGAYDIAVAANDSSGNIGVCMTRTFITPNECKDTKPANYIESCNSSPSSTSVIVTCPDGYSPSVQIPNILTCGQLRTYNLDNMYEIPDRIVCGKSTPRLVILSINLEYSTTSSCSDTVTNLVKNETDKTMGVLFKNWTDVCVSSKCSNVYIAGTCESKVVIVKFIVQNIRELLNLSRGNQHFIKTSEFVQSALQDGHTFKVQNIIGVEFRNGSRTFDFSCHEGSSLITTTCVECGSGSYYNTLTKTCELCALNYYNPDSQKTACSACPVSRSVTLQKGSSAETDCVLNCSAGYMLNLTSGSCVPCPHNFYQDKPGKQYCLPCPPKHGTNGVGSAHLLKCIEFCPPGTQLNSSGLCEPCPRGTYRVGDMQDQCTSCPGNVTTIETGHDQQSDCIIPLCPPGTFANKTDGTIYTCSPCDFGFYQPSNSSMACLSCNDSYTTETTGSINSSQCLFYCQAGYEELPPNSKTCVPCQRGFYRPSDHDNRFKNCSQCPDGSTTQGFNSESLMDCNLKMCSAGFTLSSDYSACEACPLDTYQPYDLPNTTTVCLNCTAGLGTVGLASNSSSECKLFCAPGQGNNGSCHICDRGSWNNGNTSMRFQPCQKCPENFTTDGTGATDVHNCSLRICPKGHILSSDHSTCQACPLDTYQPFDLPNTATVCLSCTAGLGTVSPASNSSNECKLFCAPGQGNNGSCHICDRGSWNNGNTSMRFQLCQTCPENFTTEGPGATDVLNCSLRACSAGTFIDDDDCKPCDVGYFQPLPYQIFCNECRANTSTSSTGSTSPDDCTIKCPAGEEGISNYTCVPCGEDEYKSDNNFGQCKNCTGDYTSDSSNRTHCTKDFCDFGREKKNTSCHDCQVGFYKEVRGNLLCTKCPIHKVTPGEASVSLNDCNITFCEPGYFYNDSSTCYACPIGTYKNASGNNQTQCTPCPSGVTTPGVGSTHIANCTLISCNAGYYRLNETHCSACVKGEYQDERDQAMCKKCPNLDGRPSTTFNIASTNMSDCYPMCPSGMFANKTNGTSYICLPCSIGFYQPNNASLNCTSCNANYTTVTTGSNSSAHCLFYCQAGYEESSINSKTCVPCQRGFYRPGDHDNRFKSCSQCPPGNTTDGYKSVSQSDCNLKKCGPGYTISSDKTCQACPRNTYQPYDLPNTTTICLNCSADHGTVGVASNSSDDCLISCSAGYYRVNKTCAPCERGEYQDESDQTQCKKCSTVYDQPSSTFNTTSTNSTDCYLKCDVGYFTILTNRSCAKCPYGSYKDNTELSTSCQACPPNLTTVITGAASLQNCTFKICQKGYYRPNSSYVDCVECPIGTYKNVSDVEVTSCYPCPTNKTTLTEGAPSEENFCIPNCPGGQEYSLEFNNCTLCPVGQYKENSTVLNVCKYCEANYTTSGLGATSCIQSLAPVLPVINITIQINVEFQLASCANEPQMNTATVNIITQIITVANKNKYHGLCPTTVCTDLTITILQICGSQGRKREATELTANVLVTLQNVQSPLTLADGTKINTEKAVLAILRYDTQPAQKLMDDNGIKIGKFSARVLCPRGSGYKQEEKRCIPCSAGQYDLNGVCTPCLKGTYSTKPQSEKCEPCPGDLTTHSAGSQSLNDCKGQCSFDVTYCGANGKCSVSSLTGKHECVCSENYIGTQCQQRQTLENPETLKIVIGISVALGAVLFIVLIVFGVCMYRKLKSRYTKSSTSETETLSNNIPYFQQPILFETPATLVDPTMYKSDAIEFYDYDPSIFGKQERRHRSSKHLEY